MLSKNQTIKTELVVYDKTVGNIHVLRNLPINKTKDKHLNEEDFETE